MEVVYGVPVESPASPTPSILPSPDLPDDRLADRPFEGLGKETLQVVRVPITPKCTRILLRSAIGEECLPGQPRICLSSDLGHPTESARDYDDLLGYLRRSHLTTKLDELLSLMTYIFAEIPTPEHIVPLHHQTAHTRQIVVNENPGLHLLWYYDRIFVKPIPAYFLSASFWTYLRAADEEVYRAAVGFMRSYHYLIRYKIDYDLACEMKLIPHDGEVPPGYDRKLLVLGREVESYPSYAEFCRFIKQFDRVGDIDTSRRYRYGELRLTRLNRAAAILYKGNLAYFSSDLQWGPKLHDFLAPIILILGGASVILSAMQVNLNAQDLLNSGGEWLSFVKTSLYFPVVTIILVAAVPGIIIFGALYKAIRELRFARRFRAPKIRSHGIV